MFNKVPQRQHQATGNVSVPSTSATDNADIDSVGLSNACAEAQSPAARMPAKDKLISINKHWTLPLTKWREFAITGIHRTENESIDETTLIDNLLKYLHVGSNDSLNIMKGIFEFHRYDTTLLDRYINKRTPQILRALEIQIENRLFVVDDKRSARDREET